MFGYFNRKYNKKSIDYNNANNDSLVIFLNDFKLKQNHQFNEDFLYVNLNYNFVLCLWYTNNENLKDELDFIYVSESELNKLKQNDTLIYEDENYTYILDIRTLDILTNNALNENSTCIYLIKLFDFITHKNEVIDLFNYENYNLWCVLYSKTKLNLNYIYQKRYDYNKKSTYVSLYYILKSLIYPTSSTLNDEDIALFFTNHHKSNLIAKYTLNKTSS